MSQTVLGWLACEGEWKSADVNAVVVNQGPSLNLRYLYRSLNPNLSLTKKTLPQALLDAAP